jgi:choline kinase
MSGYGLPKPLVRVAGRPIIAWALESLKGVSYRRLVFVALEEHERRYGVSRELREIAGRDAEVILLPEVTAGQLCTVLAARDIIDIDEDVLIASSDTLVISDLGDDLLRREPDCHGTISVADMPGDRWSFARTGADGRVLEVAEKVRISDHASTGLYHFSSGRELVQAGEAMIRERGTTGGEYYVIPAYRTFLEKGWNVSISRSREMWDLGTARAAAAFEARRGIRPDGRPPEPRKEIVDVIT